MKKSSVLEKEISKHWNLKNKLNNLKSELTSIKNSVIYPYPSNIYTMQDESNSFYPMMASNIHSILTIDYNLLTYFYKTHGVIQTAIDIPVLDALRGGIDISSGELDVDDLKEIEDTIEDIDLYRIIEEAMTWARLYGGGAIIVNTNQNPEEPLNEKNIKDLEFYVLSRWELIGEKEGKEIYPYAKEDSEYYICYGKKIHKSRVMRIKGKTAPFIIRRQLRGWGMSEIERMVKDFNRYDRTNEVIYELLEEAKIDVYKISGLANVLMTSVGNTKVNNRLSMQNQLKNFHRALVMDKEDDFIQKQLGFGGLAEILKENRIGISSALRIPMTKLFGISASGFNAGEDDIENYNGMVESEIRRKMKRVIKKTLDLIFISKVGYIPDYSFSFKPLRIISSVEEENINMSKHNRIMGLYDRSLIDSEEVGKIYEKEKLLPMETQAAKGSRDDFPQPILSPTSIGNKKKRNKK